MNNTNLNTAPTLRAQGRSTSSDDPALQAPARSTPGRGQRIGGSSSSSRWWLLLVGLIAAVLCLPFIHTVSGWAMRVYCCPALNACSEGVNFTLISLNFCRLAVSSSPRHGSA